MLRKLLGVLVAAGLPSVVAAQAAPVSSLAPAHAVATQVQGEVALSVNELDGMNNDAMNSQEGVDEADGQNNDAAFDDGEFFQEGVNEPDGMNNGTDAGDQVDQVGEDEDGGDDGDTPLPLPPAATGQLGQIGQHRP